MVNLSPLYLISNSISLKQLVTCLVHCYEVTHWGCLDYRSLETLVLLWLAPRLAIGKGQVYTQGHGYMYAKAYNSGFPSLREKMCFPLWKRIIFLCVSTKLNVTYVSHGGNTSPPTAHVNSPIGLYWGMFPQGGVCPQCAMLWKHNTTAHVYGHMGL